MTPPASQIVSAAWGAFAKRQPHNHPDSLPGLVTRTRYPDSPPRMKGEITMGIKVVTTRHDTTHHGHILPAGSTVDVEALPTPGGEGKPWRVSKVRTLPAYDHRMSEEVFARLTAASFEDVSGGGLLLDHTDITLDPYALDDFTKAYLEAALWLTTTGDDGEEPLDRNHDAADLAPEAMSKAAHDCERFQADNGSLWTESPGTGREWSVDAAAGHDFWLTRNHHGAGFWDRRGLYTDEAGTDHGDALTKAAHAYGEVGLYVGDDGRIYSS